MFFSCTGSQAFWKKKKGGGGGSTPKYMQVQIFGTVVVKIGGISTTRQKPSVVFECPALADLIVSGFVLSYPWVYVSKYRDWRGWTKINASLLVAVILTLVIVRNKLRQQHHGRPYAH